MTFVSCINQNISIRTYERGVEAETLSCGTGAVAAALCASLKNLILDSQVSVKTQGGDLKVCFNRESDIFSNIYLQSIVEKILKEFCQKMKYFQIYIFCCILLACNNNKEYWTLNREADYIGMNQCAACHQDHYTNFINTGMGKSIRPALSKYSSSDFTSQLYDSVLNFFLSSSLDF